MNTETVQNLTDRLFRIRFSKRIHTNKPFSVRATEARLFTVLDLPSISLHCFQEGFKAFRFAFQHIINGHAQLIPERQFCLISLPPVIMRIMHPGIADNGQLVLHTDLIAQSGKSFPGTQEVSELVPAIERCGAENNVIVDMSLICVRRHDIRMIAFQKTIRQLASDLVCLLGRNFSRLE